MYKVIIIGQDPYHGANQAHGLSFSVNYGIKTPPSLANIYKELKTDIDFSIPSHGNLTSLGNQGVLLLNATLTVRAGEPGSHQKKGWETFTDSIIKLISNEKENCVFLLWGNFAKTKINLIDLEKHLVLMPLILLPWLAALFLDVSIFQNKRVFDFKRYMNLLNWALPND
jgi:uracil-DNA glycosylase